MTKVLELGCGLKPYQGTLDEEVIHLDRRALPHVEQVWDLEHYPWPFPDNDFDRILAFDVLEHVSDVRRVVEEVWRIAKPQARFKVRVPHWASFLAHQDPTHRASFNEHSFDYFGLGEYSYYSHARLKVLSLKETERYPRLFRFLRALSSRLERGVKKHFLDMITSITFELEVVK